MKKQIPLMISITAIMLALICAIPSRKAQPSNKQPTICDLQGLDCYAEGLAAGSTHSGTTCPASYTNQTRQQQFCAGYKDGSANPAKYNSQGEIICDNEYNTGCHWDISTMGGIPPCIHKPPYIPDRNGKCPLPMFMRSPASQSNVSCGQILCYDMGWNAGQDAGFVKVHCPAALPLPVIINNTRIVDQDQQDAYCNGFADGQQAAAEHPGVRLHVSSSMVLSHNATGFSDTIKIMPNGSAAEIGRLHIINQTHIGSLGFKQGKISTTEKSSDGKRRNPTSSMKVVN